MSSSDIRSKLLAHNPFRSKEFDIEVPGPDGASATVRVKIKQPSVAERNAIFAEARLNKNGEVTGAAAKTGVLAIIHCVRDPDTDEQVFSSNDIDALSNTPAGGWVDTLSAKVMEVLSDDSANAKK